MTAILLMARPGITLGPNTAEAGEASGPISVLPFFEVIDVEFSNLTERSARVTWTTRFGATSKIDFFSGSQADSNPTLKTVANETEYVTKHSLNLVNLEPDTTYFVRASSNNLGYRAGSDLLQVKTKKETFLNKPDVAEISIGSPWNKPVELPFPVNLNGWEDSLSVDPNDSFKLFFSYVPIDIVNYQKDLSWAYDDMNPNPTSPAAQEFKENYIIGPERSSGTGALNTDIYVASMGENNQWSTEALPSPINNYRQDSTDEEHSPSISSDGQLLYFVKNNIGTHEDIFASSAQTSSAGWSPPVKISVNDNNPAVDDGNPFISNDGNLILFDSNRLDGQGARDIYYAVKQGDGWSRPKAITTINSSETDWQPFLTSDNRHLYFSSDRDHEEHAIYKSQRLGEGWDEWTEPQLIAHAFHIPKILGVGEPSVSTDGRKLYFLYAYQREDGRIETNSVVATNRILAPVSLISPPTNETVSETLTVKAVAADPRSIETVEFYIDEEFGLTEVLPDAENNYFYHTDTTMLGNGVHAITMRMTDVFGNQQEETDLFEVEKAAIFAQKDSSISHDTKALLESTEKSVSAGPQANQSVQITKQAVKQTRTLITPAANRSEAQPADRRPKQPGSPEIDEGCLMRSAARCGALKSLYARTQ